MHRLIAVILLCAGILCIAQSHAQVPMTGAGLGKPSSGATTPATIFGANLYAWYSADNGVTHPGSVVSAVTDLSSSGFNLSVNNAGPAWSATSFNGLPGITHANTNNDGLQSAVNNMSSANASFFIVWNVPGTALGKALSYTDSSADFNSPQNFLLDGTTGPGPLAFQDGVSVSGTVSGNACIGIVLGGGNLTLYSGTSQIAQNAQTNTLGSSATQIITGFNGQGSPANFTWAEIVITNNLAHHPEQRTSYSMATSIHIGVFHA